MFLRLLLHVFCTLFSGLTHILIYLFPFLELRSSFRFSLWCPKITFASFPAGPRGTFLCVLSLPFRSPSASAASIERQLCPAMVFRQKTETNAAHAHLCICSSAHSLGVGLVLPPQCGEHRGVEIVLPPFQGHAETVSSQRRGHDRPKRKGRHSEEQMVRKLIEVFFALLSQRPRGNSP